MKQSTGDAVILLDGDLQDTVNRKFYKNGMIVNLFMDQD